MNSRNTRRASDIATAGCRAVYGARDDLGNELHVSSYGDAWQYVRDSRFEMASGLSALDTQDACDEVTTATLNAMPRL